MVQPAARLIANKIEAFGPALPAFFMGEGAQQEIIAMADNIPLATLGRTIATDEIAGVHWPFTKLAHGADDAARRVTDTDGLPVRLDGVGDGATVTGWNGTAVSTLGYGAAFVEVTAIGNAGSLTIKGGIAAANALQVINMTTGTTLGAITGAGLYAVPAVGNLTLPSIGTAVVNLILKR